MTTNLASIGLVAIIAIGFGLLAYLAILGFRKFENWANAKVSPLFDEGRRISSSTQGKPVAQYVVTGFLNVSLEWRQIIYVDDQNIDAVKDLISRTATASYKLSAVSVIGLGYGIFLTWINYRIAKKRIAEYEASLLRTYLAH